MIIEFIEKINTDEWKLYIQIVTVVISAITLVTVFVKMSYMKRQLLDLRKSFDFERFKELSQMLSSDVLAIRVAGVLSLKELILENTRYYSPVVDTYMSYLNEKLQSKNFNVSDIVVQKIIYTLGDEVIGDIKFTDPYLRRKNNFQILFKSYFSFNNQSNMGDEPRHRIYERRKQVLQRERTLIFSNLVVESYKFSNGFYYASKFIKSKLIHVSFVQAYLECTLFTECEFNSVSFKRANLEKSVFKNCDFSNVCFDGTYLKGTRFIDCTFDDNSCLDTGVDFTPPSASEEQ